MKLDKPQNSNYAAVVVRLKTFVPLEGCDNVVGAPIFGFQAIVSKNHEIGELGIVFPVETQLSADYVKENNLFRHEEYNKDPKEKGYLEDNRRVKAMKFRGHRSDALFMPLESLKYILGNDIDKLKEGDEFDQLKGKEICKKYIIISHERANRQGQPKMFKRVDTKFIPEHFDSDNYFKFAGLLNPEADVVVTQKVHGTSIRIANTIVLRKKSFFENILSRLGVKIQETEYDYVFGSRKVIKDTNNPDHQHYYDVDIWSQEGKKLEGILPENFILYGELIGWTPTGGAIQANYTYQLPVGTCQLYVYRVAFVNAAGLVTDLPWDSMVEFCDRYGLKAVPEIWRGKVKDFDATKYIDKRLNDEYTHCLALDKPELVDEGVCLRIDRLTPYILKAKSPIFLQHESKILDTGTVDLETEGSEVAGE